MRASLSDTTASLTSTSMMSEQVRGPIEKVLVLNGDASSALGALLYDLDTIFATPGVAIAPNQREALLDLRRAAYGH